MKHLVNVVALLLGLVFLNAACFVLFGIGFGPKAEPPPEGTPTAHFFAAFGPTGWLTFVKVCELAGALFVMVPRTRCIGLLFLGPIILNILAFHVCVAQDGVMNPMLLGMAGAAVFLLLAEYRAFSFLVTRPLPGTHAK